MVIQFGTPLSGFATGVAIDGAGNVYVAGTIQEGALPGQTGLGDVDPYLRKYDGQGNEVWTRQFGTPQSDHASDVAVDGKGNVYVVGFRFDSLLGQADLGEGDIYLGKYDSAGNKLWTRQSGSRVFDMATGVAIDGAGNVYVVGQQGGVPGRPGVGESDAYLRKHDGDGNELWTRQFGSQSGPSASAVQVDAEGNVYVVGSASGSLPGQTHLGTRRTGLHLQARQRPREPRGRPDIQG